MVALFRMVVRRVHHARSAEHDVPRPVITMPSLPPMRRRPRRQGARAGHRFTVPVRG
ncbi:hypothetical protein SCATT_12400 [Streptantibioticus cattleyicolor NRRL 8057 = DSM 46488]|uniref:Uncharacterized protein n=1 Tax=Streptantibioticus cattleyicolor (strain ATCC 35852 / DSM 46488 / JCM 4925 / NBRC 14057 / NRRL 8057) TaxID=1003195 RepID=G8WRN4_STREN|nr:hypothetical protein SCATT_12400 [Streptantibioticus cattleyicolor NRRL 8057 = DSM 46488]